MHFIIRNMQTRDAFDYKQRYVFLLCTFIYANLVKPVNTQIKCPFDMSI